MFTSMIDQLQSFDTQQFRILNIKHCDREFLFHSSGCEKQIDILDPAYNRKHGLSESLYEYGIPVLFASDLPSNAFCYKPTELYNKTREEIGTAVYHRIIDDYHKIFLGGVLSGYIYVLSGKDFYEVIREDYELGEWVQSIEWISPYSITPIESIKITAPFDWEMLPEYEFLGLDYVGNIPPEEYLKRVKNESVRNAVVQCLSKPFVQCMPEALQKYVKITDKNTK